MLARHFPLNTGNAKLCVGAHRQDRRSGAVTDLVVSRWGGRFMGRHLPCSIGRGGIAREKREGDGVTPVGVFRLCQVYYRADRGRVPLTGLPAMQLGPQQGWAETPDDPLYNQSIRHPHDFPADRMARGDGLYDLCVTTDQNAACAPGAGSAIFVHLWRGPRRPTAGCVAFTRRDLRWILRHWTARSRLVIRG